MTAPAPTFPCTDCRRMSQLSGLHFCRACHRYWLDGVELSGITGMLHAVGRLGDVERIPTFYRDAGSARHAWIEAALLGRVTASTPIPKIVDPHLTAARLCIAQTGARVLGVERLVCNRAVPYATKIDALVQWNGETWLWDWKTGGTWPFYHAQLALEALCFEKLPRRACVYLTKQSNYRIEEHRDPRDFREAAAVISEYRALTRAAATPATGVRT